MRPGTSYLAPKRHKSSNLAGFSARKTMAFIRHDSVPRGSHSDGGKIMTRPLPLWQSTPPFVPYLRILAGRKAKIHQMDVNTTFLYSGLDETVYVE